MLNVKRKQISKLPVGRAKTINTLLGIGTGGHLSLADAHSRQTTEVECKINYILTVDFIKDLSPLICYYLRPPRNSELKEKQAHKR